MFSPLLDRMLDSTSPLRQRLQVLEVFQQNFHDSFNGRAFFDAIAEEARSTGDGEALRELRRIARDITRKQVGLVTAAAKHESTRVTVTSPGKSGEFAWFEEFTLKQGETAEITLASGHGETHKVKLTMRDAVSDDAARVFVEFPSEPAIDPSEFEVSYCDTPFTDNLMLPDRHRLAIVLEDVAWKAHPHRVRARSRSMSSRMGVRMAKSAGVFLFGLTLGCLLSERAGAQEPAAVSSGSAEERIPGIKSGTTAFLWSFLGTALPAAAGSYDVYRANSSSSIVPGIVVVGALVLGPSLGHFYAARPGRALVGIEIRTLAGVGILTAVFLGVSENSANDSARYSETLSIVGFALGGASLAWDIIRAPHSASVHNDQVRKGRRATLLPEPVAAQQAVSPSALSWRGGPTERCRAMILTNFGGYLQSGQTSSGSIRAVADWGVLVNVRARDAVGASLFASVGNRNSQFILGPAVRYRRWFGPNQSIDLALGTPLPLFGSGDDVAPAPYGLIKYNPTHWVGLAVRPELRRGPFGTGDGFAMSAGVELGWVPGLATTAASGFVSLIAVQAAALR